METGWYKSLIRNDKKQKNEEFPTYTKTIERRGYQFMFVIKIGACILRHGRVYDYVTMFVGTKRTIQH
jgi:hypothetical protein